MHASEPPDNRPLILVSGGSAGSESVQSMVTRLQQRGAQVVLVTEHEGRNPAADLSRVDGLIVMGNDDDVDPRDYGETDIHPETQLADSPARGNYENRIISHALEENVPILGICGGMQRINICDHARDGGTLHQHVPGLLGIDNEVHSDYAGRFTPVQEIVIRPDSALGELAGQSNAPATLFAPHGKDGVLEVDPDTMVNSVHHQAIAQLRNGFVPAAYSADDAVIEAIAPDPNGRFADHPFVMGVQWHPEFLENNLSYGLVDNVISAARERQMEREAALYRQPVAQQPAAIPLEASRLEDQLALAQQIAAIRDMQTPVLAEEQGYTAPAPVSFVERLGQGQSSNGWER